MFNMSVNSARGMVLGAAITGLSIGLAPPTRALIPVEDIPHTVVNFTSWLLDQASQLEQLITQADHYINAVENSKIVQAAYRLKRNYDTIMTKGNQWYWRAAAVQRKIEGLPNQIERMGTLSYWQHWHPPYEHAQRQGILAGIVRPQDITRMAEAYDAEARELERNVKVIEFLEEYDNATEARQHAIEEIRDEIVNLGDENQQKAMQLEALIAVYQAQQQDQDAELQAVMFSNQNNDQRRTMEKVRMATNLADTKYYSLSTDTYTGVE